MKNLTINYAIHRGDYFEIILRNGTTVLIDPNDWNRVRDLTWTPHRVYNTCYAVTGTKPQLSMHRIVMDADSGIEIDHINGDGLDNRRKNLRECVRHQNASNKGKQRGKYSSKYKGVSRERGSSKFRAIIYYQNNKIHLGCFDDEAEAARAYDVAAIEYFKDFAVTNKDLGLYNED